MSNVKLYIYILVCTNVLRDVKLFVPSGKQGAENSSYLNSVTEECLNKICGEKSFRVLLLPFKTDGEQ